MLSRSVIAGGNNCVPFQFLFSPPPPHSTVSTIARCLTRLSVAYTNDNLIVSVKIFMLCLCQRLHILLRTEPQEVIVLGDNRRMK